MTLTEAFAVGPGTQTFRVLVSKDGTSNGELKAYYAVLNGHFAPFGAEGERRWPRFQGPPTPHLSSDEGAGAHRGTWPRGV